MTDIPPNEELTRFDVHYEYKAVELANGQWQGQVKLDEDSVYFLREAHFKDKEEAEAYAKEQGATLVQAKIDALLAKMLQDTIHGDAD
jgi:hypothetical protein